MDDGTMAGEVWMDGQCCLHRNGSVEKDDGFIDVIIEQNWMNIECC